MAHGTLDRPTLTSSKNVLISGVPGTYSYASGGPILLNEVDGSLLLSVHVEQWTGSGQFFVASIGLARSTDNGDSWHWLGLIISTPFVPGPGRAWDVCQGPLVRLGKYIYGWISDIVAESDTTYGITASRALAADVFAAAATGTVTPWKKWRSGTTWDIDALTACGSFLPGTDTFTGSSRTGYWFDMTLHASTGTLFAVSLSQDVGNCIGIWQSRDGVRWSKGPVSAVTQQTFIIYPSLTFECPTGYRVGTGTLHQLYSDNDTDINVNTTIKRTLISLNTGSRRTRSNRFRGGPASAVIR
jgi:hypothetical protein